MKKIIALTVALCVASVAMSRNYYRGFVNTGYSFGHGDHGFSQWQVNTVHGIKFLANRLFVGGGIGLGISTDSDKIRTYSMPVFADVRYTGSGLIIIKPYIDVKVGHSELIDTAHDGGGDNDGGFYLSPSVGVSLPIMGVVSVNIGLGYTYNRAKHEYSPVPGTGETKHVEEKFNAGGITLNIGVSF